MRTSKKKTQAAFDTMVNHLLTQMEKAGLDNGTCFYRYKKSSTVTLKCAVGCLVPDHLYKEGMEGTAVDYLLSKSVALADTLKGVDEEMLYKVQRVHDYTMHGPEKWEDNLKKIAASYNLKWNYVGKNVDMSV